MFLTLGYEEAYKRCAQLEDCWPRSCWDLSQKLAEQKHELQEKLKLSEQLRQAARDRCEQILQQGQKRQQPRTKPQRSLQRSRTVGAIGGSGAAAAEALSSMRAMGKQADSGFRSNLSVQCVRVHLLQVWLMVQNMFILSGKNLRYFHLG
eukprot:s826_g10.t1